MTRIKATDLLEKVIEVAKERPDFVYYDEFGKDCRYFVNGQPACIVGVALDKMGVEQSIIEELEATNGSSLAVPGLFGQETGGDKYFESDDRDAVWKLSDIQLQQDQKVPWGKAAGIETKEN